MLVSLFRQYLPSQANAAKRCFALAENSTTSAIRSANAASVAVCAFYSITFSIWFELFPPPRSSSALMILSSLFIDFRVARIAHMRYSGYFDSGDRRVALVAISVDTRSCLMHASFTRRDILMSLIFSWFGRRPILFRLITYYYFSGIQ